jgi:chemotaxis signal transduction protein
VTATEGARLSSPAELARDFDQAFTRPAPPVPDPPEELLGLRIAAQQFAVRLREIAGVEADRVVVPVPSPRPEQLGLCGLRGRLVPVFSLAALLGRAQIARERHSLVLVGRERPVGLAFDALDTCLRVPREALRPLSGAAHHPLAPSAVVAGGLLWPVIELGPLMAALDPLSVQPKP